MKKKYPSFDNCYNAIPSLPVFENFDTLWDELILNIKKRPLEPVTKLKFKKTFAKETLYEIQIKGHSDLPIHGFLNIPRRISKVPVVLTLSDYWEDLENLENITVFLSHKGIAHLHIYLFNKKQALEYQKNQMSSNKKDTFSFPPLFLETFQKNPKDDYSIFLILDIIRAIDFVRLNKNLRHDRLGILGRGLGANLGIFAAAFRPESVKALALERPSLCWIESFLEYSESQIAKEYHRILKSRVFKEKKGKLLNEPLYVVDKIKIPVMMSIQMDDPIHPAYPAFGFFNLLKCEKSMQIFTEDSRQDQIKIEREKNLKFLIEVLLNE